MKMKQSFMIMMILGWSLYLMGHWGEPTRGGVMGRQTDLDKGASPSRSDFRQTEPQVQRPEAKMSFFT